LNLDKRIFDIKKGKLLGYLVSARGIRANPQKIATIVDMKPPISRKQVQKLTGRLAALNRFISRSAKKGLPFKAQIISNGGPSSSKISTSLNLN
jgi:phage FluMu protein gp41